MKYLVSTYGLGISVALLENAGAEEEINLAHNLFNCYADYSLFHGTINFTSFKKFRRYLIYKNYFNVCDENKDKPFNEFKFLREAVKRMKETIDSNVCFNNFMLQITASNNHYDIAEHGDTIEEY